MAADAQVIARPDVEKTDVGRGEVVPSDRSYEWTQEERNQIVRLKPVAPWTVGAGVDPGERHSEQSRKHGRAGADQKRIDERLRNDAVGEKRPIVVEPRVGVAAG